MGRKKRPFIDKNKSISFKLVGRSQDDPLFVDETAPQYVLVEKKTKQTFEIDPEDESKSAKKKLATADRRTEQAKYGVYFDDDYDYLQHLIDPEQVPTLSGIDVTRLPKTKNESKTIDDDGNDEHNHLAETSASSSKQKSEPKIATSLPGLMLPSSVFDSTVREKEALTKRAALPVGPQLDWDPDIVEAMEDDWNFDDPNNQIDDDFVTQAMMKGETSAAAIDSDNSYLYDFAYESAEKLPEIVEDDEEDEDDDEDYDDDDDLSVCGAASGSDDDDQAEAYDQFPSGDESNLRQILFKKMMMKQGSGKHFDDHDANDCRSTKSSASTHFTDYSISSSAMPRNEQLKSLDEKFEQMFIREYGDETQIGALDGDEEAETGGPIDPARSELMASLVDEYQQAKQAHFGMPYERNAESIAYVRNYLQQRKKNEAKKNCGKSKSKDRKSNNENESSSSSSDDTDEEAEDEEEYEEIELIDVGRKGDKDRFDCESILSINSATNYHPKILHDTDRYGNALIGRKSRHIRFDARTGMPIGIGVDRTALTSANLAKLTRQNEDCGAISVRTDATRLSELSSRPKNETSEERRARKKALKEHRAARRAEKKANREAFAEEKGRLRKVELNTTAQRKIAVI